MLSRSCCSRATGLVLLCWRKVCLFRAPVEATEQIRHHRHVHLPSSYDLLCLITANGIAALHVLLFSMIAAAVRAKTTRAGAYAVHIVQ